MCDAPARRSNAWAYDPGRHEIASRVAVLPWAGRLPPGSLMSDPDQIVAVVLLIGAVLIVIAITKNNVP